MKCTQRANVLALDFSECKKTCEQCGNEFKPRKPGGEPQRFCSIDCRRLFQKAKRRSQPRTTAQQPRTTAQQPPPPHAVIPQPKPENATPATPEASEDFDWDDAEAVVLHEQPETAVYWNPNGDLVIRQRRWPDDDVFVVITESSVDRFLDKLTDICGIPSMGKP